MKITHHIFLASIFLVLMSACTEKTSNFDASGSFEADERMISAEATGKIIELNIEEGQSLKAGTVIGEIDVSLLELQLAQIEASAGAIRQKTSDANPQINILKAQLNVQNDQTTTLSEQMKVLDKEIKRFDNLVKAKAAPQKQLDDLNGQKAILQKQLATAQAQKEVIKEQIKSATSNVNLQNRSILSEVAPTKKRMDILQKQIEDGKIVNEYAGTVLTKYANAGEFTGIGKPLYKIADLSNILLRAYITGDQLPQVKLNHKVTVATDDGKGGFTDTEGTIIWISSKAEFTPKTVQTKNERANQVYAIKVKVKNDGTYKIGMYGELKFQENE